MLMKRRKRLSDGYFQLLHANEVLFDLVWWGYYSGFSLWKQLIYKNSNLMRCTKLWNALLKREKSICVVCARRSRLISRRKGKSKKNEILNAPTKKFSVESISSTVLKFKLITSVLNEWGAGGWVYPFLFNCLYLLELWNRSSNALL